MGNQTRVILGSEVNDDRKIELQEQGSMITLPVAIYDSSGNQINLASGLVPRAYDYVSLGYTGSNVTTVVYKTGGASGTTVATLTLAYDSSSNLTSITKS